MNATWGIVLGAVLALAASIVMEVVRGWRGERRVRRLFLAVLRVEVPGTTSTLDRLADDHGALRYFPIVTVNQLLVCATRSSSSISAWPCWPKRSTVPSSCC